MKKQQESGFSVLLRGPTPAIAGKLRVDLRLFGGHRLGATSPSAAKATSPSFAGGGRTGASLVREGARLAEVGTASNITTKEPPAEPKPPPECR